MTDEYRIGVKLSRNLSQTLSAWAEQLEVSRSALIRLAIIEKFQQLDKIASRTEQNEKINQPKSDTTPIPTGSKVSPSPALVNKGVLTNEQS